MKNKKSVYHLLTYTIASVWLINGLVCKLLNLVPRHQQIVARILSGDHAAVFTKAIGVGEIAIAVWIISPYSPRLKAIVQIVLIAVMNTIEIRLAPDLLLFGWLNGVFALLLILVIYYHTFMLPVTLQQGQ